jgi:5-methylcytosine-specific restriction endonuclease McrA
MSPERREKQRQYQKRWYLENKERLLRKSRQWSKDHREALRPKNRIRMWKATQDPRIKEVRRLKAIEYRKINKDAINARAREQYATDPSERARQRRAARIYAKTERCRETQRRKRGRKKNAPGNHTLEQWLDRVTFYGWRCAYCGTLLESETLTQDHRIPLSRGGSEWASNLVPACRSCNSRKHNTSEREWKNKKLAA